MKQSRSKIADSVAKQVLESTDTQKISQQIAAYMLSERRVNELSSLLRDIQQSWAEHGYVEVLASSAHGLEDDVKDQIKAEIKKLYPEAKQIIITEKYDPQVIGGVRLNLANQQIDLSIENKLNRFKQLVTDGKD